MWIACAGRWPIVLGLLVALLPCRAPAAEPQLELREAVRQALASNLDLAAQRRQLAADREDVELARASLFPQITVGARAQHLDDDRSDSIRGNSSQDSITAAAGLSQVIYDENERAAYEIQKFLYAAQTRQLEASELAIAQEAANAFLEFDRERTILAVQQANRELTRRNLATSRARVAAGWSGEREELRWEAQLAENSIGVAQARAEALAQRFELNRVRNQERERGVAASPIDVASYGFVYARKPIAEAIARPEADRKLRDAMVRVGLGRSPDLAAIDEGIAAAERQLTARRRAFWLPSLTFGARIDHLTAESRDDSDSTFRDTEWTVGADLTFPLFEGGAKSANLRQTREGLAGLRLQRRAQVVTLGQRIGTAFARASAAWETLGLAREQEDVARRYFEIVDDSYQAGVASLISLLDGQSQLLAAQLNAANARYDFFAALVAAEREISFFPFLELDTEVNELLDRLEGQLASP